MLKNISTALFLAILASSQPAFAQTATQSDDTQTEASDTAEATPDATPEPTADTAEEVVTEADQTLSLGEEAAPEAYTKETFDAWQLQCLRIAGQEEEPCQLFQQLKDTNGTNVAEITMFRLPKGGKAVAGANVLVPLETLLSAQLNLTIDGGKAKRYPYSFCSPIGCFARVGFTQADINAFKKGAVAKLTLVPAPAPDQKVILDMSLKGFTAGFDKITE